MTFNFKLAIIDSKYCDYLRKFDHRVPFNYHEKEKRPFVGVLFSINNCEYFAPLSSPKPKHIKMKNTIDFFKLENGELGAINFNNMIPVKKSNYKVINLNKKLSSAESKKYQGLLKKQYEWLNKNYYEVCGKSFKLYDYYLKRRLKENVMNRCCNFPLLEEKCEEYESATISV